MGHLVGESARPTLCFALDLGPPPADTDEQKSPVAEEFRRLAFEGVADELENPSGDEKHQRVDPQAVKEKPGDRNGNRDENGGNPERMTEAIDRVLMAPRVLGDPLLAGASA